MNSPPTLAVRVSRSAFLLMLTLLSVSPPAAASFLPPELMDKAANVMAIIVLIVVPVVVIALFWLVHILPEKIAEKRKHPQADAIKVLCLLSLFFGGMLWPIAWIMAYSKPVLYKLAYGRDTHHEEEVPAAPPTRAEPTMPAVPNSEADELCQLRERLAQLEVRIGAVAVDTGKGAA